MFQIDTSGAVATLPTPLPVGTPGFFGDGTVVDQDWFNRVTSELLNIVTTSGQTPSKTNSAQVLAAVLLFGRPQHSSDFSSPGSYTWTCPPGVYVVRYRIWGGGGAGGAGTVAGAGGSGAGPGGYTEGFAAVTPGTTYPVVVGAGGLPVASSNGGTGGTSSFGTFGSATGGGGGYYSAGGAQTTQVGNAGGGSGSTAIFTGSQPSGGEAIAITSSFCLAGNGGGSFASQPTGVSAGGGGNGAFPGGGGGGGANGIGGTNNAGAGASGCVVLEY